MNNRKRTVACGVITSALILYIIPQYFMRGVEDVVWGALMLLFPCVVVIIMSHTYGGFPPKSVFGALLVESAIAIIFYKPISLFLGYRIQSLSQDLFAFVAYIMFAVGWSIAATFVQFITLFALEKFKGK